MTPASNVPIRVLIVDDSLVVRTLLATMLQSAPDVVVAGQAADGLQAVEMAAQLRPDVITMDIRMPRLDGLEATRRIMATCPARIVAVASSIFAADLNIAFSALAAGALTVVEKPKGLDPSDYNPVRDQLLSTIRQLAAQPVAPPARPAPPAEAPLPAGLPATVGLIALAAWTGGPGVLQQTLGELPANFPIPIVVLQHMTPNFGRGFADWLRGALRLRVAIAHDGDALEPGRVLLAPEGGHLLVARGNHVRVDLGGAPVKGLRPSATRLFESVASAYGPRAVGIVLTGLGEDGATGLAALHQAGGYVIAQAPASCVIADMPRAAIAQGAAQAVLTPAEIAQVLRRLGERQTRPAHPAQPADGRPR